MADAMGYEVLIRRIYQCARYGVEGADADLYRSFQKAVTLYELEQNAIKNKEPRLSSRPLEELEDDITQEAGEIAFYLEKGLNEAIKKYGHLLSSEELSICEENASMLLGSNKKQIDFVIDRIDSILLSKGLYPK